MKTGRVAEAGKECKPSILSVLEWDVSKSPEGFPRPPLEVPETAARENRYNRQTCYTLSDYAALFN